MELKVKEQAKFIIQLEKKAIQDLHELKEQITAGKKREVELEHELADYTEVYGELEEIHAEHK